MLARREMRRRRPCVGYTSYGIFGVVVEWTVLISDEVASWMLSLLPRDYAIAKRHIDALKRAGNEPSMPRSRSLKGGLYELRFKCEDVERRISYTFEPDRHIITLTTFRKQRNNESQEVARARDALKKRRRN